MRIVLVRHGHPNYEEDCLTELGKRQAEAAAERMADEGIERIFSSPMGRARETAEATARRIGIDKIEILPFMHELYWGARDGGTIFANGHPWDIANEMIRKGASLSDPQWYQHPLFASNRVVEEVFERKSAVDRWLETLEYRRDGLYYTCTAESDEQRTVALFAHGGSLSAIIGHMLNIPFPMICATLHLEFTGITVLSLDCKPGSISFPDIEIANDGRHVQGITEGDNICRM